MNRVVLFFICLCSLVVTGYPVAHAGTYADSHSGISTEHPSQHQRADNQSTINRSFLMADPDSELNAADIVDDDVEDEDSEEVSILTTRSVMACANISAYPSFVSLLNHCSNCFGSDKPVPVPTADKCILLGVLRI
jgi:hypothetical protein